MAILIALLIGLAVNLDNLLIGIQLGLQGRRLSIWQNLVIGGSTGFFAFISTWAARMVTGKFLLYTNLAGALLMIGFGLYCLAQACFGSETSPAPNTTTRKDILFLGFLLSINCIPPSFSAGILLLSPWWIGFFSMLFSCLSIHTSIFLGQRLMRYRCTSLLTPLSACLLIGIGILALIF